MTPGPVSAPPAPLLTVPAPASDWLAYHPAGQARTFCFLDKEQGRPDGTGSTLWCGKFSCLTGSTPLQFAGMGLLKKAVFLAMVRNLPAEETRGLCCLFQALDTPRQGFLTAAKLQVCRDSKLCSSPDMKACSCLVP